MEGFAGGSVDALDAQVGVAVEDSCVSMSRSA